MTALATSDPSRAPVAGRGWRAELRGAGLVAAMLLGLALVCAVLVRLLGAPAARGWLGFTFPGIRDEPGRVAEVLANNVRLLAGVLLAAGFAHGMSTGRTGARRLERLPVLACDALLACVVLVHVALVGAGLGAYGGRLVRALLAHGPVELLAYSLALALYLDGRRGVLTLARVARVAVTSALALALAALLEVYVSP